MREQVSIESVVQAAVAAGHDKLTTAGHRSTSTFPTQRLFVRGDRGRLAQALSHLIINAAKFTFEPSTISISVRRAARTVQIAVKDQGAGIDPEVPAACLRAVRAAGPDPGAHASAGSASA